MGTDWFNRLSYFRVKESLTFLQSLELCSEIVVSGPEGQVGLSKGNTAVNICLSIGRKSGETYSESWEEQRPSCSFWK